MHTNKKREDLLYIKESTAQRISRRYRLNLHSSAIYHMKDTVLITPAHRETLEFVQSYPLSTLEEVKVFC